jgi:hypothetical protein
MNKFIIQRQAQLGLTKLQNCSGVKLTPGAQQELWRLVRSLLEQCSLADGAEPSDELLERSQRVTQATGSKTQRVGIFYLVDHEPFVASTPWRDNPTYAGFRTFGVGHYEFWGNLVESGRVPEAAYWFYPRGRVSYCDATRRFILFTDRCVVRSKRLTRTILESFNLPSSTTVLADSYFCCGKCNPGAEPPELGFLDFNWEWLSFYLDAIGARQSRLKHRQLRRLVPVISGGAGEGRSRRLGTVRPSSASDLIRRSAPGPG